MFIRRQIESKSLFVLREGLLGLFCTGKASHHTGKLNKMFCSKISFQRNRSESAGEILTFYNGLFALDFFRHGERKVVETVYLVIFSLSSLKKDQVSSLNKKESKLQFWGWKVLT